jgi:hypothetical protein
MMATSRPLLSPLIAVGLAVAIHLDWHLARHGERLSFGWQYHWLLAIPLFAAAAWYVHRRWPGRAAAVGLWSIVAAVLLGQVLEPLAEAAIYGASHSHGFERERLTAFAYFMAAGVMTHAVVSGILTGRRAPRGPTV